MKNILLFLLVAGCSQTGSIAGIYVKHVESEYTIGEDTVFISTASNTQFVLERHTWYQRIKNGKLSDKQMKIQHSLIDNIGNNKYQDTKTGASLVFNKQELLLGTAEYQKIQ
jgi:hypothetical protein